MSKKARIVVTITEQDSHLLGNHPLSNAVDFWEIRLDQFSLEGLEEVKEVMYSVDANFIFTMRRPKDSSLEEKDEIPFSVLRSFLQRFESYKNYIDWEIDAKHPTLSEASDLQFSKIFSVHDFENCLSREEMETWIQKAREKFEPDEQRDAFKFACMPNRFQDVVQFLSDVKSISATTRICGICMGDIGILSRLFPDKSGSLFTYLCLDEPKAPGQIRLEDLIKFRKMTNSNQ